MNKENIDTIDFEKESLEMSSASTSPAQSATSLEAAVLVQSAGTSTAFTVVETDRIIEMAWEDRTPFDAIAFQFGLKEDAVKAFMKKNLKPGSYRLWRKRVEHCKTKHAKTRVAGIDRFKCNLQRNITMNKISKRR